MEITELHEYKGETWEAVLDGERRLYVNAEIVEKFSLKKGGDIAPEKLEQITAADVLRKAKKRALYLLGERLMCRAELLKKLTKTYGEKVAEKAVEYVCGLGYVNDEEYAPKLAEYLLHKKHFGKRRAKFEMLHKGLSEELVEDALGQFPEEELFEELSELIRRKYSDKIADFDSRRKTTAALARRGYDFSLIKRCIEAVLEENGDNDDLDEFDDVIYED